MLTMRAAAALLSSSRSLDQLVEVLRAAGLCGDVVEVDDNARTALGIHQESARIGAGVGIIRVLAVRVDAEPTFRDALQRLAHRLAARAPHVLWFLGAIDTATKSGAIIGWSASAAALRFASFVWNPSDVVDSDAETLCALAAVRLDDDVLCHARCLEVLGRDALTRRFYRALESQVGALAASLSRRVASDDARDVALLYVSRLLFLRFLEAKGWLNGDRAFIANAFDTCMKSGGGFHRRILLPLFFGTLNTPFARRAHAAQAFGDVPFLNGGLFNRTAIERRASEHSFSDERLGALLHELFARFRFVAREDSATWSEASVDPEMLGRAFESLMAAGERKAGGVYYTPHELVARVAEQALAPTVSASTRGTLRDIRVLDPACGSGAFLVYVLEYLATTLRSLGDARSTATIRRDVLARCIFGVDRSPTAVWLCELRLWLSVVIESDEANPQCVAPLPNLDRNIRVGDALAGAAFGPLVQPVVGSARIEHVRRRYITATGVRKSNLARVLDRMERARVLAFLDREIEATRYARSERLAAQRAPDLFGRRPPVTPNARQEIRALRDRLRALRRERQNIAEGGALPFSFPACFAQAQARGGFDVIVGNPPWVRLHHIPPPLRSQFKRRFAVFRASAWLSETGLAVAPGFASQVDLAALFVERSVSLLRDDGTLSLLLPVKLWRSLAGSALREFLTSSTAILRLDDLSESKQAFEATTYPSLLVARKTSAHHGQVTVSVHRGRTSHEWQLAVTSLAFDGTPGAPWLTLPPKGRSAFERLRDAGDTLLRRFGSPRLGVKSGCNAAFVVRVADSSRELARVVDVDGESGTVELRLLRPVLRGDGVTPWRAERNGECIIWTHDATGAPLAQLPERAAHWLRRRYGTLVARSDAVRQKRWWSLFRVDAADSRVARLVWSDFGRRPRALVLPAGDRSVPMNTCYVLPCQDETDAWALAALLNSTIAAAWLNAIAEPARGGYRRYLAWTVGLLPIPPNWNRARDILAKARGADDVTLLECVLDAYGVSHAAVDELLDAAR